MEKHLLQFERSIFISMAIGIIIAALGMKSMSQAIGMSLIIAGIQVLILLIILTITLFITRKKSNTAKWIWVVFFILGLILYIPLLGGMLDEGFIGFLSACQLLLQCYGTYVLFFGKDKIAE